MKSSSFVLAAALAATLGAMALAPQAAHAAGTNTITISGKVIDSTCSVATGSNGSPVVTLPVVQASKLNAAVGAGVDPTSFSISFSGCPSTPTGVKVAAQFSGGNINPVDGNLTNSLGSASGVEVQLLNGDGSAIDLSGSDAAGQNSEYASIGATGAATLSYEAQYYSTGTSVKAGSVNTSVEYTLVYK